MSGIIVTTDGELVTLSIPVAGKRLRVRITQQCACELAARLMMAGEPAMLRTDEKGRFADA